MRSCIRRGELKDNAVFIFADTTDAGTDQSTRRKQTLAPLGRSGLRNVFFVDMNCVLHQFHLCVKEQLEIVDAFLSQAQKAFPKALGGFTKYFASLGKAINYWWENVGDFVDLWEKFHGTKAPEGVNYRQYPLRLVSGRWGSVHAAESFFLDRQRKFLAPVWNALLSSKMKAKRDEDVEPKAKAAAAFDVLL